MTSSVASARRDERRVISKVMKESIGNLIEWYDWHTYAAFSVYFAATFFPGGNATAQLLNTAAIFAVGFLMWPIGGWLLGRFADRYGRSSGGCHVVRLRGVRMRVLLVEDDDGVASALVEALDGHGYRPTRCRRGEDALLLHRDADLVLLDLGLPGIDGFEVLRRLRRVSDMPVLVLTARGDERSLVRGLRSGADDYVVKPIRLGELLARMEAVARRSAAGGDASQRVVQVADVCVDLGARTVVVAGAVVVLTTKEFAVLAVLARYPGTAVSRQLIMDEVWGDAYLAVSRSLDVHVATLRAKLGRPGLLQTIRGFGYRFGSGSG